MTIDKGIFGKFDENITERQGLHVEKALVLVRKCTVQPNL